MNRKSASFLIWLFVCMIVIGLFLPSFLFTSNPLKEQAPPLVMLAKNWQVHYGAAPEQDANWQPFDEDQQNRLKNYKGTVWVKRTLPKLDWDYSYLFAGGMNRFELYLDGQSIYRFPKDSGLLWNHFLMTQHPIPISQEDEGKELSLRMEWDRLPFYMENWILASEPTQYLAILLQRDLSKYIYSTLYITVGLIGIVLFIRRREKLYQWFTLLALSAGFGLLLLCASLQWIIDVQALYYWKDVLLTFGVYAFVGLYGEVLGAAKRMLFRVTKSVLLLYTIATLLVGIWSPTWYWRMLVDGFPLLAIAAMSIVTYALVKHSNSVYQHNERKWLLRGYALLVLCGLGHIIANYLSTVLRQFALWPYFQGMIVNLLPNGLLLFMICMVMILVHRVGRVYQESERNAKELMLKNSELEQFHRNLEKLVDIRTEELEEANRSLSITLREKAESLAEVSVLEERNRIAHEMHDVVGHTLTAAIVQMEASKKLAMKLGNLPMDKLDTVGGLIRKGLDDIRKTVRMLKSDSPPIQLDAALRELIKDTMDTMEVTIDYDIDIPPDLGKLTEKVIYHALQEGLTNGIRHAACSSFRYSLHPIDNQLLITLWNDGKPFGHSKPGFGLTSMMERIHLLGGTITVESSKTEDGTEEGCELRITLPLQQQ